MCRAGTAPRLERVGAAGPVRARLFIQAIGTGVVYILLAVLLPIFQHQQDPGSALKADELSARNRRINELEWRFREMERKAD